MVSFTKLTKGFGHFSKVVSQSPDTPLLKPLWSHHSCLCCLWQPLASPTALRSHFSVAQTQGSECSQSSSSTWRHPVSLPGFQFAIFHCIATFQQGGLLLRKWEIWVGAALYRCPLHWQVFLSYLHICFLLQCWHTWTDAVRSWIACPSL